MSARLKNIFLKICFLMPVGFATTISNVTAAPVITSYSTTSSTVTINGSGFGDKTQAAPIMWVFGDDIRLNGRQVSLEANLSPGDMIPIRTGADTSLWTHGEGVFIDNNVRTSSLEHSYGAIGNGWVGWPYAFGGGDTPFSDKAYISWRVRTWGDINAYIAVAYQNMTGKFSVGANDYTPGEGIQILGQDGRTYNGRIVSVDTPPGIMDIEVSGVSASFIEGATIIGQSSGAKAVLNVSKFYVSSVGSKYLRIYETLSSGGMKSALTTNRWGASQYDASNTKLLSQVFEFKGDSGYGAPDISSINDWVFMESYVDLSGDYGSGYVSANNGKKKFFNDLFIAGSKPMDAGPTISNLGWEAAGGTEMINAYLSFGEIYFDKTPQRVVLSNAAEYSKSGSNQELQWINKWTNDMVEIEIHLRGLDNKSPIYLYVFDMNNNSNSTGICIKNCDSSPPPSTIKLNVN